MHVLSFHSGQTLWEGAEAAAGRLISDLGAKFPDSVGYMNTVELSPHRHP